MTKQADACRSILVSAFALFSRFGFCFCLVFPAKPLNAKASGSPPFFSSAASAATPLKTSVKGGANGADGEVFSSSSFLSHEQTFPFLSPLHLSLSPQENKPLCPYLHFSPPSRLCTLFSLPASRFFLVHPLFPVEKLSLLRPLFPPGRRETGGMGKKMSAAP